MLGIFTYFWITLMNSSTPTTSQRMLHTVPIAGEVLAARRPHRSAHPPTTPPSEIQNIFTVVATWCLVLLASLVYIVLLLLLLLSIIEVMY